MLSEWNKMVSQELPNSALKKAPIKTKEEELNTLLQETGRKIVEYFRNRPSPIKQVEIVADFFRSFVHLNAYGENTMIIAKVIANYMALRFKMPIFLFKKSDDQALLNAMNSSLDTRLYFLKRRKEAFLTQNGELGTINFEDKDNVTYSVPRGGSITVHWNEYNNEVNAWKTSVS